MTPERSNVLAMAIAAAIGPISISADNTPAAIDLLGARRAIVAIGVGVGGITFSGTNKVEFKLTHSDDGTTYTAVADVDVELGTNADASVGTGGIVKSLIADHPTADFTLVGYRGGKRYLKVLVDFSGTHGTATPITVLVITEELEISGYTG